MDLGGDNSRKKAQNVLADSFGEVYSRLVKSEPSTIVRNNHQAARIVTGRQC